MTKTRFLPTALALLATAVAMLTAVAPALAMTRAEFEAARGRYELADGRVAHLTGSVRRPRLELDDGIALPMSAARDGRIATPDGRVELELIVRDNGLVDGLRLTQRR